MAEWYVVDKESRVIVNCITSVSMPDLKIHLEFPDKYELMSDPPDEMLKNYRYFWERP